MPWRLLQPVCLDQLPSGPPRGRMLGDIEMHQPAPGVAQHHEHEQDPKRRRGDGEEIHGDQILGVILQKRDERTGLCFDSGAGVKTSGYSPFGVQRPGATVKAFDSAKHHGVCDGAILRAQLNGGGAFVRSKFREFRGFLGGLWLVGQRRSNLESVFVR